MNCTQNKPCPSGHFCNFVANSEGFCQPCSKCTDKQDRSLQPHRTAEALCGACSLNSPSVADCSYQCGVQHVTSNFDNTLNCTQGSTSLIAIPISSTSMGDTFPFEDVGEWNKETGTLKLRIVSDTIEPNTISFQFAVRNPSRNPIPAVSSAQINVVEGIEFMQVPLALPNGIVYTAAGDSSDSPMYPLFIAVAQFTLKAIGQDSAFPCDENMIAVVLVSSTPLLKACSPTLTIQGITGMRTASSVGRNLTVTDHVAGLARKGVWKQDVGVLTIEVSDFGDIINGLNFSFVLRNPAFARQALSVSVRRALSSAVHQTVTQPMTPPCPADTLQGTACSTGSFEIFDKLNFRDKDFVVYDNLVLANVSDPARPLIQAAHGISRANGSYDHLQQETPAVGGQYIPTAVPLMMMSAGCARLHSFSIASCRAQPLAWGIPA